LGIEKALPVKLQGMEEIRGPLHRDLHQSCEAEGDTHWIDRPLDRLSDSQTVVIPASSCRLGVAGLDFVIRIGILADDSRVPVGVIQVEDPVIDGTHRCLPADLAVAHPR